MTVRPLIHSLLDALESQARLLGRYELATVESLAKRVLFAESSQARAVTSATRLDDFTAALELGKVARTPESEARLAQLTREAWLARGLAEQGAEQASTALARREELPEATRQSLDTVLARVRRETQGHQPDSGSF